MKIVQNYGIEIFSHTDFEKYTTIIDALFGIGVSGVIEHNMHRSFVR